MTDHSSQEGSRGPLRVCEHVQADPDAPCNESQGAVPTVVSVEQLALKYRRLAIAATQSLGLPFGGVDLAIENGGVIFEVISVAARTTWFATDPLCEPVTTTSAAGG
jgi:glutathione synthase/RimK-type ligase-like ATP-grasp enzyme